MRALPDSSLSMSSRRPRHCSSCCWRGVAAGLPDLQRQPGPRSRVGQPGPRHLLQHPVHALDAVPDLRRPVRLFLLGSLPGQGPTRPRRPSRLCRHSRRSDAARFQPPFSLRADRATGRSPATGCGPREKQDSGNTTTNASDADQQRRLRHDAVKQQHRIGNRHDQRRQPVVDVDRAQEKSRLALELHAAMRALAVHRQPAAEQLPLAAQRAAQPQGPAQKRQESP